METQQADLVITPATWQEQSQKLQKTPNNLLNLVGWYGSTHGSATWRKDDNFLDVCQQKNIAGFDPQVVDGWDPSYATIEAEVMATASVIVIRLENNELLNGSLGSIAEIGLALTSAALRGQIVVVSIEEGLLTSLNEPGAIAQYMLLEMSLDNLDKVPALSRFFRIHRGDDLEALAAMTAEAAHRQMDTGQAGLDFESFLAKKKRRSQNYPLRVLLGGSGGAYAQAHEETFLRKKEALTSAYVAEGQAVKILSEGAIAEAWKIPYGSLDKISVALATRTLLAIETEFKQEADLLLLPIMSEAASKAAATEIGFLLLHALTTGQDIRVYLEPFDPVDFIQQQLKDVEIKEHTDEKNIRLTLHQAGVGDAILARAVQDEVQKTFEVFRALVRNQPPSLGQVKKSLLGQTEAFHNADNIRRVRALVQAHLARLAADERFSGFFSYANKIDL